MKKNGLIDRKIYRETPIRIDYCLTEKGKALKSILDQMAAASSFSVQYSFRQVFQEDQNP